MRLSVLVLIVTILDLCYLTYDGNGECVACKFLYRGQGFLSPKELNALLGRLSLSFDKHFLQKLFVVDGPSV